MINNNAISRARLRFNSAAPPLGTQFGGAFEIGGAMSGIVIRFPESLPYFRVPSGLPAHQGCRLRDLTELRHPCLVLSCSVLSCLSGLSSSRVATLTRVRESVLHRCNGLWTSGRDRTREFRTGTLFVRSISGLRSVDTDGPAIHF